MPSNNTPIEYWDLYHHDGRFAQVIPSRGFNIPKGMYHETIEIIPTDKAGHLLLTQRAFSKRIGPGKLEFPAGSVLSEEQPFVAAKRELLEETGLRATTVQKIGKFFQPSILRTVYIGYVPDLLQAEITLQEEETIGYMIVTFKEWLHLIAKERVETSKFRNYTKQMIAAIEKAVGKPPIMEAIPIPAKHYYIRTNEDIFAHHKKAESQKNSFFQKTNLDDLLDQMEEEENP